MGGSGAPVGQNTEDVGEVHLAVTVGVTRDDCGRQGILEADIIEPQFLAGDHQAIDIANDLKTTDKSTRHSALHHVDGDGTQTVMNDDPDKGAKLFHIEVMGNPLTSR